MKVLTPLLLLVYTFGLSQIKDSLRLEDFIQAQLPPKLAEASGIIRKEGKIWLLNDSHNPPCLYQLNNKANKIHLEKCLPIPNRDWEALSIDPQGNLYIGDIGNRPTQNIPLSIYRISPLDSISRLDFHYPDSLFSTKERDDADAEALFYDENGLNLLSKSWATYRLRRYPIPPDSGRVLHQKEEIKLDYWVTDASYYLGYLFTIGYNRQGQVFLSRFKKGLEGGYFQSDIRHMFLGLSFWVGQVEGIYADEQGLWIVSERFRSMLGTVPPRLYYIQWNALPRGWSS